MLSGLPALSPKHSYPEKPKNKKPKRFRNISSHIAYKKIVTTAAVDWRAESWVEEATRHLSLITGTWQ
jgi:hypothetical protein